jgi:hypothetical protein
VELSRNLERWMDTAGDDERRPALVQLSAATNPEDAVVWLKSEGLTVGTTESIYVRCEVTPGTLRDLVNEPWVAAIAEPPPGTGEPGDPGTPLPD